MKKILGIIIGVAVIILATLFIRNESYQPQQANDISFIQASIQTIDNKEIAGDRVSVGLENRNEEINGSYTVQGSESLINWTGKTFVKSQSGTINVKSGSINIDDFNLTGNIVIDMTTISSNAGQGLDNHLSSLDFFNVEKYPEATITINGYESGEINLDLTIKGITNSIVAPVTLAVEERDIFFSGILLIDRTLWEINHNSDSFFENLGDNAINDIVELSFEIKATK